MSTTKTLFKVADKPILFESYIEAVVCAGNQANLYNHPMNITAFTFDYEYGEETLVSMAIVKRIYPQK